MMLVQKTLLVETELVVSLTQCNSIKKQKVRPRLHVSSMSPFFLYRLKWFQRSPMVLKFTLNVKKIKDAAYKNDDGDGTCKRAFLLDVTSQPQFHVVVFPFSNELLMSCA